MPYSKSSLLSSTFRRYHSTSSPDYLSSERSEYKPVIIKRNFLQHTTKLDTSKPITHPGKIYSRNHHLFINEHNQGFHILDNNDPESPKPIAFLKVLGASDLTFKKDILYINNATDLIAVKLNLTLVRLSIVKRIPNIFPILLSPDGHMFYDLKADEIIIDWILKR